MTTEVQAYAAFCRMRWPETGGHPICPNCHSTRYYEIKTRHRFTCKGCRSQFSATSKTIFHSRKLSYREIMEAINVAGGYRIATTLGLAKLLATQWRTAAILTTKINDIASTSSFPSAQKTWRTRSRRVRKKTRMPIWPYLPSEHKEYGVDLLRLVSDLVPRHIPDFVRSDICQDVLVSILSGEIDRSRIMPEQIRKRIISAYKFYDLTYKTVSLDVPIAPDSRRTFADFLADDAMERWDTPTQYRG